MPSSRGWLAASTHVLAELATASDVPSDSHGRSHLSALHDSEDRCSDGPPSPGSFASGVYAYTQARCELWICGVALLCRACAPRVRLTGTSSTPPTTRRGIGNRPARRFRPARQCRPMREIRPVGERCRDAWLPETMARQFESLAVWRRVSHEGVGRLGQACVYSISGETQSRHCWWLMLAISLAHSMSGGATAGHSRTVASLLAEARWCPSGLNATNDHRAGVAWLGHPLHPLLTDLPIGAWSMAALLDALDARSADVLVGAGIAAAVPTAATGLNDWSDTYGQTTRLGLVHAATNHRTGPAGGVAGGSQPRPPRAGQSVEPGDAQPCLSAVTSADTSPSSRPSTSTTPPGPRDQTRGHKCAPWRIRPTARPGRSTLRGADPAYRRGDAVQAIDATCTHMGGPLADGKFATTA